MSKRAIYLDDRERELARRCSRYVVSAARKEAEIANATEKLCCHWLADEVTALAAKFEERAI